MKFKADGFGQRCKYYLFIRQVMAGEEPSQISLTLDGLRARIREEWGSDEQRSGKRAGAGAGDWYSQAVAESRKWLAETDAPAE